jgi:hypothetical protein
LDLLVDEGDLSRCPASISNWLVLFQHLFRVSLLSISQLALLFTDFFDLRCCLSEKRQHLVLATSFLDDQLLGDDLLRENVLRSVLVFISLPKRKYIPRSFLQSSL